MGAPDSGQKRPIKPERYFATNPRVLRVAYELPSMRIIDAQGDLTGFLGVEREAWFREGFWISRLHADDADETVAFVRKCADARQEYELVYRVVDAHGDARVVHDVATVEVTPDGRVTIHAVITDITALMRLSQRGTAADRMGRALELLSEQFGRTLNEASLYGDLLARHMANQGDDVGSDYALGLRDAVQLMRNVIEGLRETSSETTGEPVATDDRVRDLIDRIDARLDPLKRTT